MIDRPWLRSGQLRVTSMQKFTTARQGNGKRHVYNAHFEVYSCGIYSNKQAKMNVTDIRVSDGSDVTCKRCAEHVQLMRSDK